MCECICERARVCVCVAPIMVVQCTVSNLLLSGDNYAKNNLLWGNIFPISQIISSVLHALIFSTLDIMVFKSDFKNFPHVTFDSDRTI